MKEEIKKLIEASIQDGYIDQKEKEVILRKAVRMGEDPDEIEIFINSAQQKVDNASDAAAAKAKGTKCPNCGALLEPLAIKCNACGYDLKQVEVRDSVKALAAKLEEFDRNYVDKPLPQGGMQGMIGKLTDSDSMRQIHMNQRKSQAKADIIKNFPVPRTKEDLFDFSVQMQSNWKTEQDMYVRPAYKAKYDECVNKAKLLFPNDPLFAGIFEQHKKDKKTLGPLAKLHLGSLGMILFIIILFVCYTTCSH